MATPMIVTYRISSNGGEGGGGDPVSLLPHQQTEHQKIIGQFCTQVTMSNGIHLCMDMELIVLVPRRSDHL